MKTETINLFAVAAQQAGTEKAELHKKILLYPSYRANFLYTHLARIKTAEVAAASRPVSPG